MEANVRGSLRNRRHQRNGWTGLSAVLTRFGGSWILRNRAQTLSPIHLPRIRGHIPNVYEASALLVLDSRYPDLPEDNRAIRRRCAPALHKVFLNRKVHQLRVGQPRRTRPHLGLMLIPMMPRPDDFGLDIVQDDVEGLDSLDGRRMRRVEMDLFFGC